MLTYGIPPEFRGGVHSLSVHIMHSECSTTSDSMYVHTIKYDDISSIVIMLRQFDQQVPAHKIKVPSFKNDLFCELEQFQKHATLDKTPYRVNGILNTYSIYYEEEIMTTREREAGDTTYHINSLVRQ